MEQRGFRFGDWQVEVGGNSLSNGDARTTLEPRVMDVLRYLCRHPGAVIPAEELLQACWGTAELGDNPVHKAIAQLRRALGDSSTEPRYIETVRKRGYRAIADVVEEEEQAGIWQDGSPFRGLEAFEESHAAIFFGRVQATARLRETVLKQVANGCAMALALGPSGSGKTSLVRAGLLPQLMGGDGPVALSCSLHMDCADLGDGDLFGALAAVLIDAELDGTHLFDGSSAEALARRLRSEPAAVAAQLAGDGERIRISVFVDRIEAIFRTPDTTDADRIAFIQILDRLATHRVLVMLACRNDFYPELIALPEMLALKARGGHFDLEPPDGADIAQMVRLPAKAAGLTFEHDPATGANLDDVLCDAARESADALPLLQYCLNELYRLRSDEGILLFDVFRGLGGIEGALGVRAEQIFSALPAEQQAALPKVLSRLVNVGEEQNAITARRVPWIALNNLIERDLVKALVDARLFVSELTGEIPSFGVAHEALLRRWPRMVEWVDSHRQALQIRTRLTMQAERWVAAGRPRDLLLPRGSQVNQAKNLLDLSGFYLSETEREFIFGSIRRVKIGERARFATTSVICILAILAVWLGLSAKAASDDAENRRAQAEDLMGFMLGDFVEKLRPLGRLDLLDNVSARALAYLSSTIKEQTSTEVILQRAKNLHLIAEVRRARADITGSQEALVAARDLLNAEYEKKPENKVILKELGGNAFWLGQLNFDQSNWENALLYMGTYKKLGEKLVDISPTDIDALMELSYSHGSLGSIFLRQDLLQQAAQEFQLSADIKQRALKLAPQRDSLKIDLANSISGLAAVKVRLGELDSAEKLYVLEESLLAPLHEKAPTNGNWTYRLAVAKWHQAELAQATGRKAKALADYGNAEKLFIQILKQDPSNRSWEKSLYSIQLKLIEISEDEGTASLTKLIAIHDSLSKLSAAAPKRADITTIVAMTEQKISVIYWAVNRRDDARRFLSMAMEKITRLYTADRKSSSLAGLYSEAVLLKAKFDKDDNLMESALANCNAARLALDSFSTTSDYFLLVPMVKSSACMGSIKSADLWKIRLQQMGYLESSYLKFLSTTH